MDNIWQFLNLPGNEPFTVCLLIVAGLTAIQLIDFIFFGSLFSGLLENLIDFDADVDIESSVEIDHSADQMSLITRLLGWLQIGKVPMSVVLVLFLLSFGLTGISIQYVALSIFGNMLHFGIPMAMSIVLAPVLVHYIAMPFARYLPSDETYVIRMDELVGKTALITFGDATDSLPAKATVDTENGPINVRVQPDIGQSTIQQGSYVLLKERASTEGDLFVVIPKEEATL